MANRKVPPDEVILELLREHKTVRKVLEVLNSKNTSNNYILNLGKKHGIIKTKPNINNLNTIEINSKLVNTKIKDDYKIGDRFKFEDKIWTIKSIKKDIKNMYVCKDTDGFNGCFDFSHIKHLI